MATSDYKARQVRAKTQEVIDYDHDEEKPGKPLHIMIPGGLIALGALAMIIFVAYLTWVDERIAQNVGTLLCLILAPFYVGGVFLFSYGYELYNIPRAIRLTAIIVFVTVAAVVILAVLAFALGSLGGSKSSSKSSRSGSSSRSMSASNKMTGDMKGAFGGAAAGGLAQKASNSSSSGRNFGSGPIIIGGLGGGGTRVETREVTKEVVKEVPKEPMPITCPFCSRSYVPIEQNYICPSCGAATPKELIEESQMPKDE